MHIFVRIMSMANNNTVLRFCKHRTYLQKGVAPTPPETSNILSYCPTCWAGEPYGPRTLTSKDITGQFLLESIPYLQSWCNSNVQSPACLIKNVISFSFGEEAIVNAEFVQCWNQ